MRHAIVLGMVCWLCAFPVSAATHFISPNGNDSNDGISADTAWASPNHPLNCGDTITAAAGNYSASDFNTGRWGTVTCVTGITLRGCSAKLSMPAGSRRLRQTVCGSIRAIGEYRAGKLRPAKPSTGPASTPDPAETALFTT